MADRDRKRGGGPPARPGPDYVPSPAEAEAVRAYLDCRDARPRAPQAKVSHRPPGPVRMEPDHPQPAVYSILFQAAFGTTEAVLAERLLNQAVNAAHGHRAEPVAEETVNGVLAAMHGLAPRDEAEALLGVQMLATHEAAVEFLRRARRAEHLPQQRSHGGLAVKLLRTVTLQLEALHRYRGKGQQKIVVERVTVNEGGQAIVGSVEAGGAVGAGGDGENGGTSRCTAAWPCTRAGDVGRGRGAGARADHRR